MAVANELINSAINQEPFTLEDGGEQVDDWIYIKDAARALVTCTLKDEINHNIFNIGTGEGTTLKSVATILEESLPDTDLEIGSGRDYFETGPECYCIYDIERAREDLDFEPDYDLTTGLHDYIDEKTGAEL
jgi:nucleoside-diphosphate-sugar epimerase